MRSPLEVLALALLCGLAGPGAEAGMEPREERTIISFQDPAESEGWYAIDDRVMGGISRSGMDGDEAGFAVFSGVVSLERNGGFASVRSPVDRHDLGGYDTLAIRVRGDGRRYKFSVKTDGEFDGVLYQYPFQTREGEWMDIRMPIAGFLPTWRGRIVGGAPRLAGEKIRTFGFMISDKQEGPFRLEIEEIRAFREARE